MQEITTKKRATVIITSDLAAQINFMHSQCPKNTEWSGLLIYKIEEGNLEEFTNPENDKADYLEIRAEGLYPMDYGDATFTSFEGDNKWLKAFEKYPQIDPIKPEKDWYIGKIHTHHNMGAFHSGTDNNDLYTTAPKLPMFLSLVVNYACETHCRLAIATEGEEVEVKLVKSSWKVKTWKDFKKEKNRTKTVKPASKTLIVECDVTHEQSDWLVDQCEELEKLKKRTVYTPPSYNYNKPYEYKKPETTIVTDPVVQSFEINQRPAYKSMIPKLCELFSLGTVTKMTGYLAMQKLNTHLGIPDVEAYKKAFKYYYDEIWFDEVFYHYSSMGPKDGIGLVKHFISHHKNMFIYGPLTDALNDLEKELK